MKRIKTSILMLLAACLSGAVMAQVAPKREFRGAWIQCVNGQFMGMGSAELQRTLTSQLDSLQKAGINAIIFQVRPEADALYPSEYEPWSRYLTGVQGQAPNPYWDPLQFMVEQCHGREMEIHAWINPYRAKTKGTTALASNHPARLHPERFVAYDGLLCFDPGLPENRKYICNVVADIVTRYDVDGLHMDDYFYPYPVDGLPFNDDVTFATYGRGFADRGDWRRDNVNKLIREVQQTVRSVKPWVKFGISPFGIWRNKKSDPQGSDTNGLQNYDQLYADIRLWVDEGWIDYNIPQVYWQIGHTAADYATLVEWWAGHTANRPLFIGQDVMRTVQHADLNNPHIHQQQTKMQMQRAHKSIQGSCQWPASAVVDNAGGYRTALERDYHRYPALQPRFPFMDDEAPKKVKKMKVVWTTDGPVLFWTAPKAKTEMDRARQYVVYRFEKGEKVNLEDPSKIMTITSQTFYNLPYQGGEAKYTYVVTALDRLHNESKPVKKSVKL
ncbi:MAG: family 10 glycosylhydrolase [Bacteroidaceae bacterium]|nr:family 10 glycosylhydrolase [Bacteroidaceae bacterium]